jgi:hypothetical protein
VQAQEASQHARVARLASHDPEAPVAVVVARRLAARADAPAAAGNDAEAPVADAGATLPAAAKAGNG